MASTLHRYHPNPERLDDPDSLLFDGCGACLENAAKPLLRLDRSTLAALVVQRATERLHERATGVERLAMRNLMRVLFHSPYVEEHEMFLFAPDEREPLEEDEQDLYDQDQIEYWLSVYLTLRRTYET